MTARRRARSLWFPAIATAVAFVTGAACWSRDADSPTPRKLAMDASGMASLSVDTVAVLNDVMEAHQLELFRVSSGIFAPDGASVVLANGGWQQLVTYRLEDDDVTTIGRRGRGPGEFLRPLLVTRLGADSLVVYDRDQMHFVVFSNAGEYVRTFRVDGIGLRGRQPELLVSSGSRGFVSAVSSGLPARLMSPDTPAGERDRDTLAVVRFDAVGNLSDTIGRFPNRLWELLPDSTAFAVAAVEDSSHAVAASNGRLVFVGDTRSGAVSVVSVGGDAVGALDMGSASTEVLGVEPEDRRLVHLHSSSDGALWLGQSLPPREGTIYWKVRPPEATTSVSWTVVAQIRFPERSRILDSVGDQLLVRHVDSVGAESVVVVQVRPR